MGDVTPPHELSVSRSFKTQRDQAARAITLGAAFVFADIEMRLYAFASGSLHVSSPFVDPISTPSAIYPINSDTKSAINLGLLRVYCWWSGAVPPGGPNRIQVASSTTTLFINHTDRFVNSFFI